MHTVGQDVRASTAASRSPTCRTCLPRSNDPGCSAGFAHGLVTGVAPSIDPRRPREAAAVCADAGTRYQRYSCVHGLGHAFMRIYGDRLAPALALCRALGPRTAPDCAQGAYHDYWFAVARRRRGGAAGGRRHRPAHALRRPAGGVRAAVLVPRLRRQPARRDRRRLAGCTSTCSAESLDGPSARGVHHRRVPVIGPADPAAAARAVRRLDDQRDAVELHPRHEGAEPARRVDGRVRAPARTLRALRRRDARPRATAGSARRSPCSRTARSSRQGCPLLERADARRSCVAGARELEDALVTFS